MIAKRREPTPPADVTQLLARWADGDQGALDLLLPLVYDELRRIARNQLRRERGDHTLVATALVHELYFRLIDQRRTTWQNRAHFFALAAQLMRRILVDHARAADAEKRGRLLTTLVFDDAVEGDVRTAETTEAADVLAIDEALHRLAAIDADQARIVELRFFAGLTVEETAHVLKRSPRTVKREWRLARAWLYRALQS